MSSAAQRTHSGAVSITETGAAGSEVVDPHHSPLFTRQELVRAARSGGHLEGEGGKGGRGERGGWGEGGGEGEEEREREREREWEGGLVIHSPGWKGARDCARRTPAPRYFAVIRAIAP